MNERQLRYYNTLLQCFKDLPLTDENKRYLKWLSNYDNDTINNFTDMFTLLSR